MQSVPHQINYKTVEPSANPKYRYLRVPMNNLTGSSITVGPTVSQLIEFKLPNAVYSLAESYISYQTVVPAQGNGIASWTYEDNLDIATNAYFGTAGGLDLCNLNFVNRYTKVWRKARTKLSDFISNDNTSQLYPSNALASANFWPLGNAPGCIIGTGTPSAPQFPVLITPMNYLEPKYINPSVLNTARTASRLFPLKGIKDTIFSVEKDLYFPIDMYVRLTAGVGNQIAFTSTSVTDPTAGPLAITTNITIQNVYLYLAVEQNQTIVESVMNKVLTQGLRLNIPYTTAWRNATTGTVANIQLQLTQQFGRKLKRMIHTVWDPTESGPTALDCSNYNGNKMSLYNTFLDQRQLQDYQLSTLIPSGTALNTLEGAWRENKKFVEDSVIQNRSVYDLNFFHCDQFYEPREPGYDDSNIDDGLPMDTPKLWSIQATTSGNVTHYTFGTFVRPIMIDRTGVNYV